MHTCIWREKRAQCRKCALDPTTLPTPSLEKHTHWTLHAWSHWQTDSQDNRSRRWMTPSTTEKQGEHFGRQKLNRRRDICIRLTFRANRSKICQPPSARTAFSSIGLDYIDLLLRVLCFVFIFPPVISHRHTTVAIMPRIKLKLQVSLGGYWVLWS